MSEHPTRGRNADHRTGSKAKDFDPGRSLQQDSNTVPGFHSVFAFSHADEGTFDPKGYEALHNGIGTPDQFEESTQKPLTKNPSGMSDEDKVAVMTSDRKLLLDQGRNSISASNMLVAQDLEKGATHPQLNDTGLELRKYFSKAHPNEPSGPFFNQPETKMTNKTSHVGNPLGEEQDTVQNAVESAVDACDDLANGEFYKDDQVHPTMIAEAHPQIKENIFSTETPMGSPSAHQNSRGTRPSASKFLRDNLVIEHESETPGSPPISSPTFNISFAPTQPQGAGKAESKQGRVANPKNSLAKTQQVGIKSTLQKQDTIRIENPPAILEKSFKLEKPDTMGSPMNLRVHTCQPDLGSSQEARSTSRTISVDDEALHQPVQMLAKQDADVNSEREVTEIQYSVQDFFLVPDGHIPLFGDCFSNAPTADCTKIFKREDGNDYILKRSSKFVEFLDLSEKDAIYGSTFGMMIKEAFRENKDFIFAKIQSRASDRFTDLDSAMARQFQDNEEAETLLARQGEVISNYFNVFSIIKIIFKKKGDSYVGRFHPDFNIAATNPLTNHRIVGEVEFFFVENPYLKISSGQARYSQEQSLSLQGVKGCFIGSDYNFQFSSALRQKVFENCLQDNQSQMLFKEHRGIDLRIQRMLLNNGVEDEQGRLIDSMNEIDNHIHEIVYQSFQQSNRYMVSGFVLGIYRIVSLTTFVLGAMAASQDEYAPHQYEPLLALNLFAVFLPVMQVVSDEYLLIQIERREIPLLKVFKIVLALVFWVVLLMTYYNYYQSPVIQEKLDILDAYKEEYSKRKISIERSKAIFNNSSSSLYPPSQSSSTSDLEGDEDILSMRIEIVPMLKPHFIILNIWAILYPAIVSLYSKLIQEYKGMTRPSDYGTIRISPQQNNNNISDDGPVLDPPASPDSDEFEQPPPGGDPFGSQNELQEIELPGQSLRASSERAPSRNGFADSINDISAPLPSQPPAQVEEEKFEYMDEHSEDLNSNRAIRGYFNDPPRQVAQTISPRRLPSASEDPYISNLRDVVTSPAVPPQTNARSAQSNVHSMRDFQEIRTLQQMVERIPNQSDLQRLRRMANFSNSLGRRGQTISDFAGDPILSNNPREQRVVDFDLGRHISRTETMML